MRDASPRGATAAIALAFVGVVIVACGKDPPPPVKDYKCQDDADCTISCEKRGSCCKAPCCETAVHKAVHVAAMNYNKDFCSKSDLKNCPVVGACPGTDYTMAARCNAGTGACFAEKVPRPILSPDGLSSAPAASSAPPPPPPEPTVDLKGYDRACTKKEDCRVVSDTPCDHCKCADKPIAAKEASRFAAAAAAVECPTRPKKQCGECKGFVRDCEKGVCIAKPE